MNEGTRQVTRTARVVLAPNPGPMTLEGTNTWVLRGGDGPGGSGTVGDPDAASIVIDPGPLHEGHLQRVIDTAGRVDLILLTHHHLDHSEAAGRLAALTGAPVRALDPAHRLGGEGLADGDVIERCGVRLRVIATPGHTADSLSFILDPDDPGTGPDSDCGDAGGASRPALLTGDTVLGRGTTVVVHPDGNLAAYLDSLHRLADLPPMSVLPGHGPELPDVATAARTYLAHRHARLDQVRQAVRDGARTAAQVVERVYADVDRALWPAAELSVRAQLEYLGVT